jgi:uncharacterized membrane protein
MGVSIGTLALVVISQVVKRRRSSRQVGIAVGISHALGWRADGDWDIQRGSVWWHIRTV